MSSEEMEFVDKRDAFLDLYGSVIKYNDKKDITVAEYHNIHEAIVSGKEFRKLLIRNGAEKDIMDDVEKRINELMTMSEYFSEENKIVYKPKKKMKKKKKEKSKELSLFYDSRRAFLKRYAKALTLQKEDMITATQYSDLMEDVRFGKTILEEVFPLTQENPDKKFLEERIDFISRVSEVYRIGKHFWENCKVAVDSAWVDQDWNQEDM